MKSSFLSYNIFGKGTEGIFIQSFQPKQYQVSLAARELNLKSFSVQEE